MTQSSAGNNRRAREAKKLDRYGGVCSSVTKGRLVCRWLGSCLSSVSGSVLDKWSKRQKNKTTKEQ
jgi:hypothetical protein